MMQETFKDMLFDWWKEFKEDTFSFITTLIIVCAALGFGLYKANGWYTQYKEGKAQIVFSQALEEYDRALFQLKQGEPEKGMWEDTALAFRMVQSQHAGTTYATYAQAFQADIDARQGNYQAAIDQLQQAISKMGAKSPGWYLFKTKLALLQLDAGAADAGLLELQELAQDAQNAQSDTAAFFLGYYYWTHEDRAKAQEVWERFKQENQPTDPEKVSPWAQIVQTKLSQIA